MKKKNIMYYKKRIIIVEIATQIANPSGFLTAIIHIGKETGYTTCRQLVHYGNLMATGGRIITYYPEAVKHCEYDTDNINSTLTTLRNSSLQFH